MHDAGDDQRIDVDPQWISTADPTVPDQVPDAAYVDYVEHSEDGRANGQTSHDGGAALLDDPDTTPAFTAIDPADELMDEYDDEGDAYDDEEDAEDAAEDDDADIASMDGPAGR